MTPSKARWFLLGMLAGWAMLAVYSAAIKEPPKAPTIEWSNATAGPGNGFFKPNADTISAVVNGAEVARFGKQGCAITADGLLMIDGKIPDGTWTGPAYWPIVDRATSR
jgi:hypothetical protein